MPFKKEIREKSERINRTETLTDTILGYDVFVVTEEDGTVRLSIAPEKWDRIRLGIIQCYPRNVADIEKFADDAHDLFMTIAQNLRAEGKIDLRNRYEKISDEMHERFFK